MMPHDRTGPGIPDWVHDAVFYHIFPDRFANGDPSNDPPNVAPWGAEPTHYNSMGGDLQGIIDRLGYLLDLGVSAIYLTPIFLSSSNHKYNPYDYYAVDPRFGTMATFERLLAEAHAAGIRIILDGVFNHCGRGFFPFFDVLENHEESQYVDWFYIKRFPVNAYGSHTYEAWGNSRKMPQLNVANPETRRYLLEVARFWTAKGIDGWRLDAAAAVKDRSFWTDFRHVVKGANPQAYIVGEVWDDASAWLQGDAFDGTTNYALRGALLDFFVYGTARASEFVRRTRDLLIKYYWSATSAMFNMLGSHDTARVMSLAHEDSRKVALAMLCLLTYPGVPVIYYGDEIGMLGDNDLLNRRAMPWDQACWNAALRAHIQRAVTLRRQLRSLRHGTWQPLDEFVSDETNTCVFLRRTLGEVAIVVINNGPQSPTIAIPLSKYQLPAGVEFVDVFGSTPVERRQGELVLRGIAPYQGAVIAARGGA